MRATSRPGSGRRLGVLLGVCLTASSTVAMAAGAPTAPPVASRAVDAVPLGGGPWEADLSEILVAHPAVLAAAVAGPPATPLAPVSVPASVVPSVLPVLARPASPAPAAVCSVSAVSAVSSGAALPASLTVDLSSAQAANASVVVAAAKGMGLPRQAASIAVMTALQESSLLNLANTSVPASRSLPNQGSGSDHDSLGLFQQRPSMAWGSVAQLMSPQYAATRFLRALVSVPGWQGMVPWQAAQAVQRSANGTAYAQWTPLADAVSSALWGGLRGLSCSTSPTPDLFPAGLTGPDARVVSAALAYAQAQLGKPYVFGATGPGSFDCSGLTMRAYAAAGVRIPRVAADQARIGTPVAYADLMPGDLVFWAYDVNDPATIHHVALYIGNGLVLEAPHTGDVVKIARLWLSGYAGAVRVTSGAGGGLPGNLDALLRAAQPTAAPYDGPGTDDGGAVAPGRHSSNGATSHSAPPSTGTPTVASSPPSTPASTPTGGPTSLPTSTATGGATPTEAPTSTATPTATATGTATAASTATATSTETPSSSPASSPSTSTTTSLPSPSTPTSTPASTPTTSTPTPSDSSTATTTGEPTSSEAASPASAGTSTSTATDAASLSATEATSSTAVP